MGKFGIPVVGPGHWPRLSSVARLASGFIFLYYRYSLGCCFSYFELLLMFEVFTGVRLQTEKTDLDSTPFAFS